MKSRAIGLGMAVGLTALSMVGANAAPINGTLSIGGTNIIDYTADTIQFVAGSEVGAASGTFAGAGFNNNDVVTMRNEGVAISYTSPALALGSNLGCGTGCVFSANSGTGNIATFNIIGPYTVVENPNSSLTITATGNASLTGFDLTEGTFFFSSQAPGGVAVTFSATTVAVPGPIAGAGLPGLIAACGGLLALARRRRAASVRV